MSNAKLIIFSIIFVSAAIASTVLLYRKQTALIAQDPSYVAREQEILGTSVNTPSIETVKTDTQYTEANKNDHITLNDANIIWLTNFERVQAGLKPLVINKRLQISSLRKNQDMFVYHYFAHTRPGYESAGFDTFIDAENYLFIKIGENLAMGDFSTSNEVVQAWMKSPVHRKNILDPSYHEIGVATTEGMMSGKQVIMITQHFGDPRTSCPTIDLTKKESIDQLRRKITQLQITINDEQKKGTQTGESTSPATADTWIAHYNALVESYNQSLKEMADLVQVYNTQVQKFDLCISRKK